MKEKARPWKAGAEESLNLSAGIIRNYLKKITKLENAGE